MTVPRHFDDAVPVARVWLALATTPDWDPMARDVVYTEARCPLDAIVNGPALEVDAGLEWSAHGAPDVILLDLRNRPDLGDGLGATDIRNREAAAESLPRRGLAGAQTKAVRRARDIDPDDRVRDRRAALLRPGGAVLGIRDPGDCPAPPRWLASGPWPARSSPG
ncbi:MAG: hypothetical protein AAF390_18810 [Pseudomonadota bacterium]